MPEVKHKFLPETTNNGYCFSECSCGWSAGVYPNRADARLVWNNHSKGNPESTVENIKSTLLIGDSARGMTDG